MQGQRSQDKPVPDARREYLDEDFSEEEAEKKRLEDEFSGLSKATYEEKELDKLVDIVREMTILSGLIDTDWNAQCILTIREFFEKPINPCLTIYFENDVLTAALFFPVNPVAELSYFVRNPYEVYSAEHFRASVLFGSVNTNVEDSLLRMVNNVLTPIFAKVKTWPDSVREDFSSKVQSFLCNLTDLRYKMLGLTVIYQPREAIGLSAEASVDKELVKRFEGIVVHWSRQIRIALGDQDQSTVGELICFKDTYDFWLYRYDNLRGLMQQLDTDSCQGVLIVLGAVRSTHLRQLQILIDEIERSILEAKSNVEFLNMLKEPCLERLVGCRHPTELLQHLADVIQICRVIWTNSTYIGNEERMTKLFGVIANQVIGICRNAVSLDDLFHGKTRKTIEMLIESITTCQQFKILYNQISSAHNKLTDQKWELPADQIFRYIDVFIIRCNNLLEISQAMIDFARMDETTEMPKVQFNGSKGSAHEQMYMKIERRFGEILSWLRRISTKILDVRQSTWYDDMSLFRSEIKKLELAVEHLMDDTFKHAGNILDSLQALHGFRYFSGREKLQKQFDDKTDLIWQMLDNEIQLTKQELIAERTEYPSFSPYFAGRALNLLMKSNKLSRLTKQLGDSAIQRIIDTKNNEARVKIFQHCSALVDSIAGQTAALYRKWLVQVGDHPQSYLTRYLMRRVESAGNDNFAELLECDVDPRLLSLCKEAGYWLDFRFELPVNVQEINARWKSLQFVYENVVAIVGAYNKIILALSDEERPLFRELIDQVDKKIKPGLTKLTWSSDYIEEYIKNCNAQTSKLQEFIDTYKECSWEIFKIAESICAVEMIQFRPNHVYELEELVMQMDLSRHRAIDVHVSQYQRILKYLLVVYEGLQRVIEHCLAEWKIYLLRFDKLLKEAFKLSLKNSLSLMYDVLHGDGTVAPTPIIRLTVDLVKNKIKFTPSLTDVGQLVSNFFGQILHSLTIIPQLVEKFNLQDFETKPFWKSYLEDEDLDRLRQMSSNEVFYCFTQVQNYLKTWEPFRDIWEVNKELFIQRYEKLKPTVTLFDAEITRYTEVANNVSLQETVVIVHFLEINVDRLKAAITQECSVWQQKLTELLLVMTERKVHRIYKYVADNGKRITKEPTDLITMQAALQLFERLTSEIPIEEKEFPAIRQQHETLEKYEIQVSSDVRRKIRDLDECWASYLEVITASELLLEQKKEEFKNKLIKEYGNIIESITQLLKNFYVEAPFTPEWKTKDARAWLSHTRKKAITIKEKLNKTHKDLSIFSISQPDSFELNILITELTALEVVWDITNEWDQAWNRFKTGNFWSIETDEMEETANILFRKLTRLSRELKEKNWSVVDGSRSRVDKFRRTLPLIIDLKNPAMQERHWTKVMQLIGTDFDRHSDKFTLGAITDMKMYNFAEEIADISNAATMELGIEMGLKSINEVWKTVPIVMEAYKDTGIYKLKAVDEITPILEEHQVQLSAMKSTRFVEPFAVEVDYWERALSTVGEILEMVLNVQKSYWYLDNIFSAEDIRQQLPRETQDFDRLTSSWRNITSKMASSALALKATQPPGLLNTLNALCNKLEVIQRQLEQYLETKRWVFPRFYFISNDDLLEILANSKKPELIQPHIKKLFENIKHIKLGKSLSGKAVAEGMSSAEGEYVQFLKPVLLEGPVEFWLCYIEEAMHECLREVLRQCRMALRQMLAQRDKWVKEWQSQPGITSTQIQWTTDCTRILHQCKLTESKKPLKKLKKKQNQALAKYSEAVRGKLNRLQRLKFKAIVVIEIHARDVIEKMYKMNCRDVTAFEWLSQLRFYWERDVDNCIVRQTNTHFTYGYEYLGNSERLVITPLTDRCYITLTTALHLHRGGSPKGPAGTGKTETTKDLGKALGFNVIVVNCSEGLDYKSMGRMFSGLAQTGAWGCFDEFNRINIEVLSVVAQQILSIITALTQNQTRFVFEGLEISLKSTCGMFITMNPGYAGRTELPDNLKSMFRPISMMVPDSSMIAEINLFGEGFQNTRSLAKKVDTLYSLAKQQLSKQFHYDFGLRGIVTLTRYAGKKKRQYPNLPDEEVVILAMNDMNIAKLTTDDLPLFLGITSDLFPGVQAPTINYEELIGYITAEAIKLKLQPVPALITKVIELYETKNSRHSSMIVGQSNTGKSATWRTLQNTLTTMAREGKPGFNVVHEFPMNPKALNLGELYGEYNLSTGEWSDGVISSIMRKTCADESPDEKWIVFDGPVDAVWIENMNSVMDDNKILTLINNDRITLPEQVSLVFEVEDLAVASPATVSRAGMVYNDYKDLGWRPYVNSWLEKYQAKPAFVEEMNQHFATYVDKILEFKRIECNELVNVPEPNAVQSLCKLLEVLATPQNGVELLDNREAFNSTCKLWFLFCMIWSLCASVNEEGRQKIDNFLREMDSSIFPMRDTVYEYYVDVKQRVFVSWEEKLSPTWRFPTGAAFYKITVPTVDTVRYDFLVNVLLTNEFPVLLVGPVGTGKTSIAQSVLNSLDSLKYSLLVLNMSAQTSSKNVQDAIESRVEKRTKGIYVPNGGKTMITFMDDFNMPMKETYGSQPPLELIRQWIGYGFWYDRQNQSQKYVQKMQLIGSMGPPGGGRNTVTNRLISKFNVINMTFPAEKQIARIYGTMLNQQLLDFHPEVKALALDITKATVSMYNSVVLNMLPTPMKIHYLFNLRDISKVFQGLLRSHKDYQFSKQTFLRLWIHEVFRVFSDRLVDDQDRDWFASALNEQLGKYFESTFPGLCPDKRSPVFGAFMNAWNIYEDLRDIAAVRKNAEAQMEEHNSTPGVVRLDLVLFRDALEHICRIMRVISEPRGNMLLVGIGGSGRQSLSRLAAYMCELTTFQVEVSKQYTVVEFREDLKVLYSLTGVDNKPTSFLFNDTQIVEEQFLEIVNNMLSTGEISSLFKNDELEDIKNKLSKDAAKAGVTPTTEAIYLFLIQRVRANLHVILCMSPIGEAFRNRLRQYPALINCTTIDWFHEWPRDALLEVGNKFLMNLDFTLTITGEKKEEEEENGIPAAQLQDQTRDAIASTFSLIQDTVSQFSRRMSAEMKRYNYVTPTNFLELVFGYKQMLGEKRLELSEQGNKLRNGLFKLDDTKEKVKEMALELVVTQQQVQRSTLECEEFLVSIVSQRRDADETQKLVTARSVKIAEESKVCKQLEAVARADLASVEPALNEAMMALDALSKKDISEVKSFTRPPAKVEMVMEAVMILKNSEPSWAESKRQLGDVNFINTLRDFDKDHISDKTLRTITKYTSNPEFEPEKVGIVSNAAKSLSMWVIAMEQYGKLLKIVAPKRANLQAALKSLNEKEAALAAAMDQLQKLQQELERLQQVYDAKMKEKEDLINLEELLKLKLERAAMLVDGLSGERVRWESSVEELNGLFDSLPGDCLIATAFISYLGPFVSNYRDALVRIWAAEVREKEIPSSPKLDVKVFLSDPTSIREWNIQGLPSDDFSTENGIIITRGSRWPLVIDPQVQAVKWIRNMEAKNSLRIIDFGQPDFTKTVELAIQFGRPVLLQNVGEILEPVMDSVLQKAFIKTGDMLMIKFNDKMITYNDKFRLFITTKLSNPHYPPEISTKTTLCNFAIKEQGLETQLLGIVVRKEKPQLEEQKDNLVLTIATGKRTLKELENKILYLLSVSSGSLLDDLDLITTLQTSKKTAITIQESLVVSEKTEKEIDAAREGYRACSKRAALLFFVLNDMSLIDPMYQFSLDAYISLFNISIDKSPKNSELAERILALNTYHTYALYRNTCRGLFEQHKLLFSFHMCIKILEAQDKIHQVEYSFLLTGGIVVDRETQPDKPVAWIPDESWDSITELEKLPGFNGLVSSFEQYPREWFAWYTSNEPEAMQLVSEFEERSNEFQRMMIIRSCRADRMTSCLRSFIVHNLGQAFVEPPVLDVKAVLDDSTERTPLIFVLSPGVDPTSALIQLAENFDMTDRFMSLSLGQGQAPIATKMIEAGAKQGAWVFLANCHLSLSWMPKLDKIVENLGNSKKVHPDFRLWLSSSPTPQFPISILQAGIKMTTEPPKGLKANMKRLYGLMNETQFEICNAKSKYKKLLFSLVFFHSILLERKKFQQLGWNVVYSFNDADFEVSENLLQVYLDEYPETPWDALKYLIAGICYGGHVTDDWDRRLLLAYVEDYMNELVLTVNHYRLSSLPTYYVPRDGSLETYRDFINALPMTDRPEVFGQHPNADITSLIIETRMTFETLMSMQMQVDVSDESVSTEDRVIQLSQDIISKLPSPIDYERTEHLIGPKKGPLHVVLLQEISRYNDLLVKTHANLRDLCQAIQGLVVMSAELEETFICVQENRVPSSWSKAYPSLKNLGSWTRDLILRVEHFAKWAETTQPPTLFWLAAFTFPTGFLTAVLQTAARRSGVSIDTLSWEFQVFKGDDETSVITPPKDGVFIRSTFLEGAGWNKKTAALVDPAPMQLFYNMPIIHFKPTEQGRKKTKGLYNCPCYYYPQRCGDQGRPAYVVTVDLNAGSESAAFWTKRGTALLLSLAT